MSLTKFYLLASTLAFISLISPHVHADDTATDNVASFPNDTRTHLMETGPDCDVVHIEDAFLTQFGAAGQSGFALVVQATIQNIDYNKDVSITHTESSGQKNETRVATNPDWHQNVATIFYQGQSGGRDRVTIVDRSAPSPVGDQFVLQVWMQNTVHTCSARVALPNP